MVSRRCATTSRTTHCLATVGRSQSSPDNLCSKSTRAVETRTEERAGINGDWRFRRHWRHRISSNQSRRPRYDRCTLDDLRDVFGEIVGYRVSRRHIPVSRRRNLSFVQTVVFRVRGSRGGFHVWNANVRRLSRRDTAGQRARICPATGSAGTSGLRRATRSSSARTPRSPPGPAIRCLRSTHCGPKPTARLA